MSGEVLIFCVFLEHMVKLLTIKEAQFGAQPGPQLEPQLELSLDLSLVSKKLLEYAQRLFNYSFDFNALPLPYQERF